MLRKILIVILCLFLLALPVLADNSVTRMVSSVSVSNTGECQIGLSVTLHLDSPVENLSFPLPAAAKDVTVNGSKAKTWQDGTFRRADISAYTTNVAGDILLTVQYTLPQTVTVTDGETGTLELPLLYGFAYPISSLEFTVTLPGEVTERPTFSSGYFQDRIESYLVFSVNGATVSGASSSQLEDHETLTMYLTVPAEQFSGIRQLDENFRITDYLAMGCMILALLYWLLTLRCLPTWPVRKPTALEGVTAGELGRRLTGTGGNLTMMVLSWAELGYLVLQLDDSGRVWLHKRMEMGNERNGFENRCFKSLFGSRKIVDGTGYHYARLCRKIGKSSRNPGGVYRSRSGNPLICQGLITASAGLVGASLAICWTQSVLGRAVLIPLLGGFGIFSAQIFQNWARNLYLQRGISRILCLICLAVWLIFAAALQLMPLIILSLIVQILGGLAIAYGGRRSEPGRQAMQHILGLRRHLKNASREELQQIAAGNPNYFYEMAPYALALGVDRTFARHYGPEILPECSFLLTRHPSQMTAVEWASLLRDVAEILDERQRRLPLERLLGQ